ncbi:hypothetical protein ACFSX5_02755 [Devosia albogilva]|uniref:Alpha 1,4-glycosyltransferase domain-containing protein n=1 Tax=Devosia albogilva TaxID=429726 RepID=A0ABW5QFY1_9HYPH
MLPTIVSFWHGPVSWLERLSAATFLAAGHRVDVYSYEPLEGLPAGVNRMDAASILPAEELVFYKGHGTPAVFSDRFRLMLMAEERGLWADLDMICLKPLENLPDYVLGYETPKSINNAVLRIPAGSPLLAAMLGVFTALERRLVVPYLPPMRRVEVAVRRLFGEKVPPEDMQFGATGPFPLTYFCKHLGIGPIQPQGVFYPVPYERVGSLLEPGSRLEDYVTERTLAVHVWRSQITRRGRAGVPEPHPDSALGKLRLRFVPGER